jgi:hypothetical protein
MINNLSPGTLPNGTIDAASIENEPGLYQSIVCQTYASRSVSSSSVSRQVTRTYRFMTQGGHHVATPAIAAF